MLSLILLRVIAPLASAHACVPCSSMFPGSVIKFPKQSVTKVHKTVAKC